MTSSGALLLQLTTEIANEKESEGPRTATGIGTGMCGILAAMATLAVAEAAVLVDDGQIGVHRQQILQVTGRWLRDLDYDLFFCDCIIFYSGSASRFPYQKLGSNCVIYPLSVFIYSHLSVLPSRSVQVSM